MESFSLCLIVGFVVRALFCHAGLVLFLSCKLNPAGNQAMLKSSREKDLTISKTVRIDWGV